MKCPDIYAIYLPQFHETKHNNQWWGDGYTEWTAVKEAKPLFEGHRQPRIPLNENYYDLLCKDTMVSQAKLAKQYGVNGFVFYHYYFGNGNMELEKPAENLLRCQDIDMPFCFDWANPSWIRTWSKWSGNIWNTAHDKQADTGDDGVLVKQIYGDREEWGRHFFYMLSFFKDSRYIRIEDKPLLFIYEPDMIPCLKDMVQCWRRMARESGLQGLYVIGQKIWHNAAGLDAVMIDYTPWGYKKHKPTKVRTENGVSIIDYEDYWKETILLEPVDGVKTYFEGRCGYDNTPRNGKYGDVIAGQTPELFQKNFSKLLKKSIYYENEMVVIDAWNEWGEGMYIEPDEMDGAAYLEAVAQSRFAVERITNDEIEAFGNEIERNNATSDTKLRNTEKYRMFAGVYGVWVDLLQKERGIFCEYLEKRGFRRIAIYGMAEMGKKLLRQLEIEKVEVSYLIDQNVANIGDYVMLRPQDDLLEVDLIIITAYDDGGIKQLLRKKTQARVEHISELLMKLAEEE